MTDVEGYEKLVFLTTEIGHRLSGSPALERAIDWAYGEMEREGLDNVRHHSEADTLDKVDPQNFRKAVAMLGIVGYILADMPGTLPRVRE